MAAEVFARDSRLVTSDQRPETRSGSLGMKVFRRNPERSRGFRSRLATRDLKISNVISKRSQTGFEILLRSRPVSPLDFEITLFLIFFELRVFQAGNSRGFGTALRSRTSAQSSDP